MKFLRNRPIIFANFEKTQKNKWFFEIIFFSTICAFWMIIMYSSTFVENYAYGTLKYFLNHFRRILLFSSCIKIRFFENSSEFLENVPPLLFLGKAEKRQETSWDFINIFFRPREVSKFIITVVAVEELILQVSENLENGQNRQMWLPPNSVSVENYV